MVTLRGRKGEGESDFERIPFASQKKKKEDDTKNLNVSERAAADLPTHAPGGAEAGLSRSMSSEDRPEGAQIRSKPSRGPRKWAN